MKLKHVGMIVVSVLAMSSAAVSAAEGDESVTTTVNGGVIHLIETGCVWHGYAHPSNLPIFISFLMRNGLYLERYEKSHNI
ncbi:hypothetical protein LOD06_002758 [Escherichia coli]|nr:hypothetical protein [Escherichia coli]EIM0995812.1 hypothetical protein [Escherichia coli]EIN0671805.1 hypothetical protein [Escherichia coli]